MKRRLKRVRDKVAAASSEEGFYDKVILDGPEDSGIQLSDILESFTVLRCAHPVRLFDFCPTNHAVSVGVAVGKDTAMVSPIRNMLEIYSIPNPISSTRAMTTTRRLMKINSQ